jgi:hypothetical protein
VVGLIALLANIMGPAFLIIGLPLLIIGMFTSKKSNKGWGVFIGLFGVCLTICGWMPAIFVAYHYNLGFIIGAILVIVTFIIGTKIADYYL